MRLGGINSVLPIASRMWNPGELIKAAVFTRIGIGLLRLEENIPTAKRKPHLTKEQKYASFFERVFMEVFGVGLQVFSIYSLQEPVSRLFESVGYLRSPSIKNLESSFARNLTREQKNAINKAFHNVYASSVSKHPKGIIAKQIFHKNSVIAKPGEVKRIIAKLLGFNDIKSLPKHVLDASNRLIGGYHRKLWVASAVTLGTGVVASALLTGYLMQWLNDSVVAKKIIPWINQKIGISSSKPDNTALTPQIMARFMQTPAPMRSSGHNNRGGF